MEMCSAPPPCSICSPLSLVLGLRYFLLVCVLIVVFRATRRGAVLTAFIVIYALCGLNGGLVAGRLFKQLKGVNWVWNVVLTAGMFPLPLAGVFCWVNSIAWYHNSTAALPATTILVNIIFAFIKSVTLLMISSPVLTLICIVAYVLDHLPGALPSDGGWGCGRQEHHFRVQASMPVRLHTCVLLLDA